MREGAERCETLVEEPVVSIGAGDGVKVNIGVIIEGVVADRDGLGDSGVNCRDDEPDHHGDHGDELHRKDKRASEIRRAEMDARN